MPGATAETRHRPEGPLPDSMVMSVPWRVAPSTMASRSQKTSTVGTPAFPRAWPPTESHTPPMRPVLSPGTAIEHQLSRRDIPLREKTLWPILHETAARAECRFARAISTTACLWAELEGQVLFFVVHETSEAPSELQPPFHRLF